MGELRLVRLRYTKPALDDLKDIAGYLDPRSPGGARQVRHRVKSLIEQLCDQPFLGKRTEDPTIRRLTAVPYPYLIFYEVTEEDIIIHAVRHAARNPSSMPRRI